MTPAPRVLALLFGLLAALPAAARPADQPETAAQVLRQGYVAAWDRADPQAIAAFFAADGDFINPTGFHAEGRAAIAAFYAQAFAAGYAGSRGGFAPSRVRAVRPDVVVVDGEWSIEGARTPDGQPRPREHGVATAVLRRDPDGWRVVALREHEAP
jgi:uncharacterized protein (TIGR02246 family)